MSLMRSLRRLRGGATAAGPAWASRAAAALLWVSLLGIAIGAFAAAGGQAGAELGPVRLSLRSPRNPFAAAIVGGALAGYLLGWSAAARRLGAITRVVGAAAGAIAFALALAMLVVSITFGSGVAGGSDASGYVNEARLWSDGRLVVPVPIAQEIPLPNDIHTFSPLGFRPAREGHAIVPTYPPGLPLMMAAASWLGGAGAEFLIVPISAAGVVALAYVFGCRVGGPLTGLLGAVGTAVSPVLLIQAFQPVSDVPAAFWWLLSLVLLMHPGTLAALAAGSAAAVASLVRPNLFVLVPLVACFALWWEAPRPLADRLRRAVAFMLPVVPAALMFLSLQRALYGAVGETGYGSLTSMFSIAHVVANLSRYPVWMIDLHTPLILLALVGPVAIARGYVTPRLPPILATRAAWSGLLLFAALLGFYLLYLPFDGWPFLRFLLPALPVVIGLSWVAVAAACQHLPGVGPALLVGLLVGIPTWGVTRAHGYGVFHLRAAEQRYIGVARVVERLPPHSVFLAMLHSGSLTYYTDRPIIRWDWIGTDHIEQLTTALHAAGRPAYVVLDEFEEAEFRNHFAGTSMLERLGERHFIPTESTVHSASIYPLDTNPSAPTGSGDAPRRSRERR